MSVGNVLAILLPVMAGYVGGITATLWYLGQRIDRLEDRLGDRMSHVEDSVSHLREDVAVLKATR